MKPIQVGMNEQTLVVLCDDGSLWQLEKLGNYWIKLPEVRELTEQETKHMRENIELWAWGSAGKCLTPK